MKTKTLNLVILFAGLFLLNSCNGPSAKNYEKFPPGADFEKVFNAMGRIMKENPKFYEIKGTLKIKSNNMYPPTNMTVTYIPERNNDSFYEYNYNMIDGVWSGPTEVTLHEGSRSGRKMGRNELNEVIFKREEMPEFSLFESIYEKALKAADMGEDGHVVGYDMNKFDGNNNFFITISTKDDKTKKAVYFDKAGNVLKTIDL